MEPNDGRRDADVSALNFMDKPPSRMQMFIGDQKPNTNHFGNETEF
jgi:hypothetical protein